ncbi:MAG TPA: serine hydroxymethyltransferase, partial [Chitinophagales bacterium]|nr:serine hydroxymethyltransferase [Chitinophagales bacterium]
DAALGKAEITVNKNMVPFDDKSPFITSGIRIGTAAITTRGLKEQDCIQVVEWIDAILMESSNIALIEEIKGNVNEFMQQFPLY